MTKIEFPQRYQHILELDTIKFPAIVDGEQIVCRITKEQMQENFGLGKLDFEADFIEHRTKFEQWAKEEILKKKSYDQSD